MQIEELRVRLSADMASLRQALQEIRSKMSSVDKGVKETQQRFDTMSKQSADAMNSTADAVGKARGSIKEIVSSVNEAISKFGDLGKASYEAMSGFSNKEVFKIDFEETKNELADLEANIKDMYREMDITQFKIDVGEVNAVEGVRTLASLNGELDTAEKYAEELRARLEFSNGSTGLENTTKQLENLKLQAYQAKLAWEQAEKALAELGRTDGWDTDEAQAQIRLVGQLEQEYLHLKEAVSTAQKETNPPEPEKWSVLGANLQQISNAYDMMKEKAQGAINAVVEWGKYQLTIGGVASNIGFLAKQFVKLPGVIATTTKRLGSFMNRLNPIPKVVGKIQKSVSTLISKIKTAFIYSAINEWFKEMRDQVQGYLSVNTELQNSLKLGRGAWLTAFQPIWEQIVPALINLLNWLTKVGYAVATFTARFNGKTVAQNQANAEALYNQAKAVEEVGSSAKEASKYLAPFDELNVMTDTSSSGSGTGADEENNVLFGEIPDVKEYSSWGEAFSDMLDKLIAKLPNFYKVMETASQKVNDFSKNLLEMFRYNGVQDKITTLAQGLANGFNNLLNGVNWTQLGQSLGAGIDSAFNFLYNFITTFDWRKLGQSVAEGINGLFKEIDMKRVGTTIASIVNLIWQTLAGFVTSLNWKQLANKAWDLATSAVKAIDFNSIANALGGLAGGLTQAIMTIVGKALDSLKDYFRKKTEEAGGNVILGFFKGIIDAIKGIGTWIKEHIFRPFIDGFKSAFGIHSPSTVMEEQGHYIIEGLLKGIQDSWKVLQKWIQSAFADMMKWCSDTWNSIHQTANTSWDKIRKVISDIVDKLRKNVVETWTNWKNDIIKLQTEFTEWLDKNWNELKTKIVNTATSLKNSIETLWNNMKSSVMSIMNSLKSGLENAWNSLKNTVISIHNSMKSNLESGWNSIKSTITSLANTTKSNVQTAWNGIKTAVSNATISIKNESSTLWGNVKATILGIASTIKLSVSNVFIEMKEIIIETFVELSEGLKNPINGVIGFINDMIDGVVKGMNNMISALNKLKFDVPDWVPGIGGETFGFNISPISAPSIPYLARGGVVENPTLAMMGEYPGVKNNPEIATPQSVLRETMADANDELIDTLIQLTRQLIGAIGELDMEVNIGDDTIAKSVQRSNLASIRRTGKPLIATI